MCIWTIIWKNNWSNIISLADLIELTYFKMLKILDSYYWEFYSLVKYTEIAGHSHAIALYIIEWQPNGEYRLNWPLPLWKTRTCCKTFWRWPGDTNEQGVTRKDILLVSRHVECHTGEVLTRWVAWYHVLIKNARVHNWWLSNPSHTLVID